MSHPSICFFGCLTEKDESMKAGCKRGGESIFCMVFAGRLICMFNYQNAEHGLEEGSWSFVQLIISACLFHI